MRPKKIFKNFLIFYFAVTVVLQYFPGFKLTAGYERVFLLAFLISILNTFVKPLIKLILLPLNIITLGFFNWLSIFIVFFIATVYVKGVEIIGFTYSGFYSDLFTINDMKVHRYLSYLLSSLFVYIIYKLVKKIT